MSVSREAAERLRAHLLKEEHQTGGTFQWLKGKAAELRRAQEGTARSPKAPPRAAARTSAPPKPSRCCSR